MAPGLFAKVLANAGHDVHWSVAQQVARAVVVAGLTSGEYVTKAKAAERAVKYQPDAERLTRSWPTVIVELYRTGAGPQWVAGDLGLNGEAFDRLQVSRSPSGLAASPTSGLRTRDCNRRRHGEAPEA